MFYYHAEKYIDFDVAVSEQEIAKYLIRFHYSLIDVDGSKRL